MTKNFSAFAAIGMSLAGSLCAQSLYDLAPDDAETESIPLNWTAGVNFGIDDNPTPLLGNDDSSAFGQAYIGASFLTNTPQSTLSVGVQVGVIHYFDNLDALGQGVDDTSFTVSGFANYTRHISERLRFVSRNRLAYELEPDFSEGFQSQRQVGNFLTWSTDQALGYRWSERLATYTGIRLNGIVFDDINDADRFTWTLYNDFRYQLSQRTVATLTYRYSETEGDGDVTDSRNQFILAGLEHRFSQNTTGTIRAGAQIRDVDNGEDSTNPYLEASLRTQVNPRLGINAYARYSTEDYARSLGGSIYSGTDTLRLGFTADYQVSQALSLTGGVNYARLSYEDLISGPGEDSVDEDLFNTFIGFDLKVAANVTVNGRYNFEDLSSDAGNRDYERNRYTLGVSTTF